MSDEVESMKAWCWCCVGVAKECTACWGCGLCPSNVGVCEDSEWAWWLGGAFVHEIGIESVIFIVGI